MESAEDPDGAEWTATLEAFADTIIPGEKRSPDDRAVAGVSEGGGAVAAGALALLEMPEGGMAPMLEDLASALDTYAEKYREEHGLGVDDTAPPFVTLEYQDRVALVEELTLPGHPEKVLWTGLALFCNMAFDTGAHLHTTEAIAAGHVGLLAIGYRPPNADGLWRFPEFSYRRPLAKLHPDTIASGSLA
ncbi:DUF5987 family protein [Streptomyces polygonati]|uniref:DUF5987 family protein n=1 Tax=Streptomyces polygonati TaxID=1617087 RepID=A0ABV8HNM1_9ACTN